MLTQDRLRQLIGYDPATGIFTRLVPAGRWGRIPPGTRAGTEGSPDEYTALRVDGTLYAGHQLAWLYVRGYIPEQIDHKNLVKNDNSWSNLREASPKQNQANLPITKRNRSGFKGVSWHAKVGQWRATIADEHGRHRHLGYFDDPKAAFSVYSQEALKIRGDFARLS